ncbi:tyrosyl-DNA phosphodiesterase I [Phascolomyces articulosus]|uniref:Tyrosyl-DNA phosphodiesterase I n=1 Tax=Phascolomyces articulosus TaxID=60185 RepID=A0AAD5P9B0_9FUNG|nr:tyrosyl-DNA phosphodiesterase I [Phascolomyces articulosus]
MSLGKPVEKLTAREVLLGQSSSSTKRPFPSDKTSSSSNVERPLKIPTLPGPTRYWDGVVKLTYVTGFTGPNFIRFEDIVQRNGVKKAVLTAMVVSTDWIEQQFPASANICIVLHGRPAMSRQMSSNRIFIMPPMKDDKFGVFHPKLMLLVHESSLRVVIGSANLEPYDYKDLENVVFIQDFPLLKTKPLDSKTQLKPFAREIYDLLGHMQVPSSVQAELFKYDFSRAKAHIVASVSGVFEGDQYSRYGHARLAKVIKELGAADPNRPPQVEMQTSSLGGLNVSYLNELYRSFSGIEPYANGSKPPRQTKSGTLPPIDVIYPTTDTVNDSRLGPPGASTICLNTSSWRKPTFPKQVMCDAISHRPGTLMHSKYIVTTLKSNKTTPSSSSSSKSDDTTATNNKELKGWVYCGSHNATMAAWGKLSISKDTKKPKMAINNWELGVVIPLYEDSDIPVTYRRPPPRYKPSQNAWTQDMSW